MANTEIHVFENGPIVVKGPITLNDSEGKPFDLEGKDKIALCRCGSSEAAPFCDGAHKRCGFESKVSAS